MTSESSPSSSPPPLETTPQHLTDRSEDFRVKIDFTPENVSDYWVNRSQQNYDMLSELNPHLAEVYADLIEENNQLATIHINPNVVGSYAHFNPIGLQDDKYVPEIVYNVNNPETYISPDALVSLRQFAMILGVDHEEIKNNPKLVSTFIFLHEFGHATHFIDNHLKPYENTGKPLAEILSDAYSDMQLARLKDLMTLPIPTHIDFKNQSNFDKYKTRLGYYGIVREPDGSFNEQKVTANNNVIYREMETESFPDDFATNYLLKHYDDYFLNLGEADDGSGRVKRHELLPMNTEDLYLSGIRDGKSITITKTAGEKDSNVPIGYTRTGFVIGHPEIGKDLHIQEDIHNPTVTNIAEIASAHRQLLASGKNVFTIKTTQGNEISIKLNPDITPEEIPTTPEVLCSYLALQPNTEVIIMKLSGESTDKDSIPIGKVLIGPLLDTPKVDQLLTLLGPGGGQTPPIKKASVTWRSWHIETADGSVYEIVPCNI